MIALVGLGVRVWFTLDVVPDTPLPGDPRTYHLLGTNLADGLGYVRPAEINPPAAALTPTGEFPPGLPAIVALATKLGARAPERQALLTCLVGAGTVMLVGLLGRRVGGDAVGLVAASIGAVHPLFFQPDGVLMSESPYFLLVSGILLAALGALDDPGRWWRWSILGLVIGFATLTRPEALLFVPLLVIPLGLARGRCARARAVAVSVALGATAVVVSPWILHVSATFDRFVPVSTNAGVALLGANCDETYRGRLLGSWEFGCIAQVAARHPERSRIRAGGPTEAEVYNFWRGEGLGYLVDHLDELPKVIPVRVLRTFSLWNPRAQIDFDVPEGRNRAFQTIGYWFGLALLPFAVAGATVAWRVRHAVAAVLLVPVAVAVLDSALLYGSTKMRAVAEPSLAVLAAVGIVGLVEHRSRASDPRTLTASRSGE